jgi:oligoendopeptidase F
MNAMIYSGKNNIPNPALDISESQSQCNELLFLAYLVNNENKLGANLTDAIKKYRIRDCFRIILLSTIMDQFEQEVYSNSSNYTKDQLNDVMLEVCENMGGYEEIKQALQGGDPLEYYHRAIVDSQFYYISYATSLIPAVNMYEEGIKDYNNAQNIYKSIYEFDSNNYKFKDGIENAGLNNPFDEEAFIGLTNLLA